MLKRRIFAASLASVLALSSFSAAAFAADEKTTAYASKSDLQNLVKTCKDFKDKELENYGEISANKFTNALDYADAVLTNTDASLDDYAVSYTMLKAAKDNLTIKTLDELKALVEKWESVYAKDNILNEDIGDGTEDYQYTETTYDTFAAAYDDAESVVDFDSTDSKEITDAWEALNEAGNGLVEKPYILKSDFASAMNKLAAAQKNEFKYNAWVRGTVDGSGTKYDGDTYAWGFLFYHVDSAFTNIQSQYNLITKNKSLTRTTNDAIINACKACEVSYKVLNGFTPDKVKTYRSKKAVLDIFDDYAEKMLKNETIGAAVFTALGFTNSTTTVSNDLFDPEKGSSFANLAADDNASKAKFVEKLVSNGKLKLKVKNATGVKNDPTTGFKIESASAESDTGFIAKQNVVINVMDYIDWVNILGANSASLSTKQTKSIWDTVTEHQPKKSNGTSDKVLGGDDSLLGGDDGGKNLGHTAFTTLGNTSTGWKSDANGVVPSAAVRNSDKSKSIVPDLATVLTVLNGGTTVETAETVGESGDANNDYDTLDKAARKTELEKIDYTSALLTENLKDNVNGNEWNAIGQYLELVMQDYFEEDDTSKSLAEYNKLISECDELILKTADSAVFSVKNSKLVSERDKAIKIANATTNKKVTAAQYNDLKDAKDKLDKEYKAFAYTYQEIYDYIAMVEKAADKISGSDALKEQAKNVAFMLLGAPDLKTSDDSGDTIADAAVEDGEFKGYNRVYTNDGTLSIETVDGDKAELAKSKGGANQSHYDLKKAYEALQTAYDALTSPTTTKGDVHLNLNSIHFWTQMLKNVH